MAKKEYRITFSERQRVALLLLLGEAEARFDLKKLLPEHEQRSAAYKAIRKLRNALPTTPQKRTT